MQENVTELSQECFPFLSPSRARHPSAKALHVQEDSFSAAVSCGVYSLPSLAGWDCPYSLTAHVIDVQMQTWHNNSAIVARNHF